MSSLIRSVNGSRKSPYHDLSESEIESLKKDILSIDADLNIFVFNDDRANGTSYLDDIDVIVVRGNVLPDTSSGSAHPRDIMSARAVLAHEYYGHRKHRHTDLEPGDLEDEYRASRTAAEITPGLTTEERRHLVLDAMERKREMGVIPELDDFMRRILHE